MVVRAASDSGLTIEASRTASRAVQAPVSTGNPRKSAFYLLGTDNYTASYANPHTSGKVAVTTSTAITYADTIQYGNTVDAVVGPAAGSWWKVDLNADSSGRQLVLTHLSFRQRVGTWASYNKMQACTIEGSPDDSAWTTLATVTDGGMNEADSSWTDIPLSAGLAYRYVRLTMNGLDTSGAYYLCIGGIELAGTFIGDPG